MERLAEQIVDWHNRHPLARRITAGDVHTVGVVALPFVRASAQAGGLVEPVLTDAVGFDELGGAPPVSRFAVWLQRLRDLPGRLRGRPATTQWRAFNEKFLPGLSPAQVERFALAHGFAEAPASPEVRPWRVIVIDEALAATHAGWPFELYLMSAGIDVGEQRTRVLAGRGIPSEIAGRRLWDLRRIAAVAGLALVGVVIAAYAMWPEGTRADRETAAAPAALAPSAPASAAVAVAASTSTLAAPVAPADSPPSEPGADDEPAQAASSSDIRPRLVPRVDSLPRPPLLSSRTTTADAQQPPQPASGAAPPTQPALASSGATPTDARLARMAEAPPQTVVALVGPPGSKADAEALLQRMQAGLAGVHSNPAALQGEVIQTPEGWRATVWPFASREQAQLINATLVARGLKTKAINF